MPDYDFIPAPLWLITVLHVLTLTLHLVAMNFLVGGIVIVLFGGFKDRWNHPAVQRFLKVFPTVMAATVTIGVAPLLFAQLVYGEQLYAASIVSGWLWLLIPAVVIVSYYLLYAGAFRAASRRTGTWLLLALAGLIYVSLVYSSVFALAEKPDLQASLYAESQSGLVVNPELGAWGLRWLHMMTGAIAVGAFVFGLVASKDADAWAAARRFFLGGLIAAAVVGMAYLLTLGELLLPFMKSGGIWFVMVGFLLAAVAIPLYFKRRFVLAGTTLLVSILSMVAARHDLRIVALREHFDPSTLRVSPQWDVFVLFLVCFVLALGLVAWMLRLFFAGRGEPGAIPGA
jgi:hypothetical protein